MVGSDAEQAPSIIENFVRQLLVANKAVQLYPAGSSIPRENAAVAVGVLEGALALYPEVTLAVTKQGLYFQELPVFPGQSAFISFSLELYNRGLALVRFHAGVCIDDVLAFLTVLKSSPEEAVVAGGFEAMLWEQSVSSVSVVETQVTLVDQTVEAGEEEADDSQSDVSLKAVEVRPSTLRTRERIEIARVAGDRRLLMEYLTQRQEAGDHDSEFVELQKRFTELARLASESSGSNQDNFMRIFADALWALEPGLRRELLGDGILPQARTSASIAGALQRIDLEEIVRLLADGPEDFDDRRAGFTRALKTLVQISQLERDHVVGVASAVMREGGATQQQIDGVINRAAPTKLHVRRTSTSARMSDSAAATVLALVSQAPVAAAGDADSDLELAALRSEAAMGVTEGDIIATLVSLAGMDSRAEHFAGVMSALEDALDALVACGEIEVAADAAISLVDAAGNPGLTAEQTRRLEAAITRFARPDDIRAITHTLRVYTPGQPEYEAAQRLLTTLGVLAIRPMLEQLATEPDRAERKALVDLISKSASKYVMELGSHVTDPRWFFVRNVVAILGATRSTDALAPLDRALRHPEPRVRREAIRSVSMIPDKRANDMLVLALDDDDGQNVQLAARYLGARNLPMAAPALEAVARGEGHGNRDTGPRVEAIEALGRMGARSALPTLEGIARKRSLMGGSRARELRAAATAAISAILAKGGGQ